MAELRESFRRNRIGAAVTDVVIEDGPVATKKKEDQGVIFSINESPPWYMLAILGLQHYLTMFGATVSLFFVVAKSLCLDLNVVLKAEMLGTVFFVMGLATMLQSIFGVRLPIIQGVTATLLLPVTSIIETMEKCPASIGNRSVDNITNEFIYPKLQLVSGTLMVASLVQILVGLTGTVGLLLRFIGPLVISPTITLIGLSLFGVASQRAEGQWWIALMTSFLIFVFMHYISRLPIPCPIRKSGGEWRRKWFYPFRTCSVISGILISWAICAILTKLDVFPNDPTKWGYAARTDKSLGVIQNTPWIQWPYPGRWGAPRLYAAGLLGLAAGFFASVVESVGDYFACARLAGAVPPPTFAVNRGISMEGFCCFIAAALGLPVMTTSYSENVAAIGITRVGSRRVVQAAAVFMLLFGILPKIGAVFVSIPDPIYGGVFLTMFGMLSGVGLSSLQHVDLNSSRNLFILGSALFVGLALPSWIEANASKGVINTTVPMLDKTLQIVLTIKMFVGGFLAFILDLILPGTDEERGLTRWRTDGKEGQEASRKQILDTYDLRWMKKIFSRFPSLRFIPVCPTYAKYKESVPEHHEINDTKF